MKIKKTVNVPNMMCEHCVKTIEDATKTLEPASFKANIDKKEVYLTFKNDIDDEKIKEAITNADFEVKEITTSKTLF